MFDIIKLPSGFYALFTNEGKLVNAALVKWSGDAKNGNAPNYFDICGRDNRFEYYQSAEGTVYYTDTNGKNARVWCPASQLRAHLHQLAAIYSRRRA